MAGPESELSEEENCEMDANDVKDAKDDWCLVGSKNNVKRGTKKIREAEKKARRREKLLKKKNDAELALKSASAGASASTSAVDVTAQCGSLNPTVPLPSPVADTLQIPGDVYVSPMQTRLFSEIAARSVRPVASSGTDIVPDLVVTPVFKTPAPDGPYIDEIVAEILSLNGENYVGSITPVEARKMIFEAALGFSQTNLASITIGFNRGCIVTFKLKQQVDLDQLYEKEYFELEIRVGQDICIVACKIRGGRNPSNGPAHVSKATTSQGPPPVDDGTRLVRIVGCEYRLSESEILDRLGCFGEVVSEITEERFDSQGLDPTLPPIGNGTYIVRMKLVKDMPNWVPMFGRKICLEYR